MFGGAALNAIHALLTTAAGSARRAGRPRARAMRVGIIPPTEAEVAGWRRFARGTRSSRSREGADGRDGRRDFWLRTTSETTAELNGIIGGSPLVQKTVLPVEAQANLSVRLAPGQSSAVVAPIVERLLREALPAGAELELALWSTGEPAWIDPEAERDPACAGRVRVRARGASRARAERRLDPGRRRARRQGDPGDRRGVLAADARRCTLPNENLPASALVQGVETIVATLSAAFGELG